jgi:hypothetical protein
LRVAHSPGTSDSACGAGPTQPARRRPAPCVHLQRIATAHVDGDRRGCVDDEIVGAPRLARASPPRASDSGAGARPGRRGTRVLAELHLPISSPVRPTESRARAARVSIHSPARSLSSRTTRESVQEAPSSHLSSQPPCAGGLRIRLAPRPSTSAAAAARPTQRQRERRSGSPGHAGGGGSRRSGRSRSSRSRTSGSGSPLPSQR